MGRKKWNVLNKDKKIELSEKIVETLDEITAIKDDFKKEFEFFDLLDEKINDCFECDRKCSSCSSKDRALCMENFRVINLYILKKLKMYEKSLDKFEEGIEYWCKLFLNLLKKDIINENVDVLEDDIDDYHKIVKPSKNNNNVEISNPCLNDMFS